MTFKKLKNKTPVAFVLLIGMNASALAQKVEEGGGRGGDEGAGAGAGIDCNGLGTAISNGTFYERTQPAPPISGSYTFVDPGLSINSVGMPANSGVLVGSSMRVQVANTGNTNGVFTGITTKADCVTASLAIPQSGGSSRLFWDTGSGMNPPAGTSYPYHILNDANSTDGHSQFGCFQATGVDFATGASYYDFTYTLNFASQTQVDGVYWESFSQGGGGGLGGGGGSGTNYEVYVNGVQINNAISTNSGTTIDSNGGGTATVTYHSMNFSGLNLSGTGNTVRVRAIGADPVLGDFAVLGCCPVPEPSSVFLLFSGFAMVLGRRRRQ